MSGRGNDLQGRRGLGDVQQPGIYPGRQNIPSPAVPWPESDAGGFGAGQVAAGAARFDPGVPVIQQCSNGVTVQYVNNVRSILALQANPFRKYLKIQNNAVVGSPATSSAIRVGYGKPADLTSYRIVVDGIDEPNVVPVDAIWLFGETAVLQQVVLIEG